MGGSCKKDTGGTCGWFSCAGSRNAECQSSKCMCAGDTCAQGGKCVEPQNLFAAGRNATRNDDMTLAERQEIQKYEDWKVMVNVAVFAAWVGAATGVLLAGAFFLRQDLQPRRCWPRGKAHGQWRPRVRERFVGTRGLPSLARRDLSRWLDRF